MVCGNRLWEMGNDPVYGQRENYFLHDRRDEGSGGGRFFPSETNIGGRLKKICRKSKDGGQKPHKYKRYKEMYTYGMQAVMESAGTYLGLPVPWFMLRCRGRHP